MGALGLVFLGFLVKYGGWSLGLAPSSNGLGYQVLILEIGVRIPVGSPEARFIKFIHFLQNMRLKKFDFALVYSIPYAGRVNVHCDLCYTGN